MTSKSFHLNKPFLLKPAAKNYLWGGNRLNDDFAKGIEMQPLAETWECSAHPDGTSLVASGAYCGWGLDQLLKKHPEFLGTHPKTHGELPILIKFIDAKRDLSIQVHPDDTYAMEHENGQLGKTEMWYVLDSAKDARIVYGLSHDTDRDTLKKHIERGTIENILQFVSIRKDDVFFLEPGTIHAIGAGVLLVEIQENSNLTYRIFDYERTDKDGRKRELHIEKALDVARLKRNAEPVQPMRVLRYRQGCAIEQLGRCKYFQVERLLLNTERCRTMVTVGTDELSFQAFLCIDGCGSVYTDEHDTIAFFKGDCLFVPANSIEMKLHGKAQLLRVRC